MATILITGGMGFVGSRLAYALMKKNHKVVIMDNMSYGNFDNAIVNYENILESCIFYRRDVSKMSDVIYVFKQHDFDYVYNFAGIAPLPDCQMDKHTCYDTNTMGTLNVLEQSRMCGVKRFMLSSSNALYENIDEKDFPVSEDVDIETTLIYPSSKLAAENLCKSFHRTYGMPTTIFRFANVYGEGMDILRKYPPVTGAFIKNLWLNKSPTIYGDGTQSRDFIYVDDLVDLVMKPMENDSNDLEIMNVGTGKSYSIIDQLNIIKSIMNVNEIKPIYKTHDEFWEKMPAIYNGIYKIDSMILKHEVEKRTLMDITYAKETYGWEPKHSFMEGLKKTVNGMVSALYRRENNVEDNDR